jgi:uncharacterized iron-regulated protein
MHSHCNLTDLHTVRLVHKTIVRTIIFILTLSLMWACGAHAPLKTKMKLYTSPPSIMIKSLSELQKKQIQHADIILLGETHDHPTHHQLQAAVIAWLKPNTVAFEMLNHSQQSVLDDIHQKALSSWGEVLTWTKRGWPKFDLYAPIFEVIQKLKIPMIAAHPDKKTILPLKLGKELESSLIKELALDRPLDPKSLAELEEEIKIGHCGYAPEGLMRLMIQAQRLKDAWMARAVLRAKKPVVLIVGRGHTLMHRGIPWAIKQLSDKPFKLQVIDFTLNHNGSDDLSKISIKATEKDSSIKVATVLHRKDDPCARFKAKLEKMKKAHQKRMKSE